jgi:hypothetical protein
MGGVSNMSRAYRFIEEFNEDITKAGETVGLAYTLIGSALGETEGEVRIWYLFRRPDGTTFELMGQETYYDSNYPTDELEDFAWRLNVDEEGMASLKARLLRADLLLPDFFDREGA